jgi:hypothetical protein
MNFSSLDKSRIEADWLLCSSRILSEVW